jgi:hypothetical protein
MGIPGSPKPVRYFASIIYQTSGDIREVEEKLMSHLGPILTKTDSKPFSQTNYYAKEMGDNLLRRFILFKTLRRREELPFVKLITNNLEKDTSVNGRRTFNIDPGYLSLEQVILATTKGYTHRIYLDKGIFADLTLIYTNGTYGSLPWTYPDYGGHEIISMVNCWRDKYKEDLRGWSGSGKTPPTI